MKRTIHILLCILLACCLYSCIDLTDELTVNADGSGSLRLTLDMGMAASAMNSDNTQMDVSILEKIKAISSGAGAALKDAPGISNVQSTTEEKKGFYRVSFDFDKSSNLNKALYKIFGQKKKSLFPSLVKVSKHKVVKTNLSPYIKKAFAKKKMNSYNEMLYSFITMKSIVHLPSDLKKATNIKSVVDDPRTVKTDFTLRELLDGGFNFGNVITF